MGAGIGVVGVESRDFEVFVLVLCRLFDEVEKVRKGAYVVFFELLEPLGFYVLDHSELVCVPKLVQIVEDPHVSGYRELERGVGHLPVDTEG
jgi:hypothetical protein